MNYAKKSIYIMTFIFLITTHQAWPAQAATAAVPSSSDAGATGHILDAWAYPHQQQPKNNTINGKTPEEQNLAKHLAPYVTKIRFLPKSQLASDYKYYKQDRKLPQKGCDFAILQSGLTSGQIVANDLNAENYAQLNGWMFTYRAVRSKPYALNSDDAGKFVDNQGSDVLKKLGKQVVGTAIPAKDIVKRITDAGIVLPQEKKESKNS